MRCPFCNTDKDKVIDSRSSEAGKVIRRRRQCTQCSRRFTTYERVEDTARRDGESPTKVLDDFIDGKRALWGISLAAGTGIGLADADTEDGEVY